MRALFAFFLKMIIKSMNESSNLFRCVTESRNRWKPVRYKKMNGLMSGFLKISRETRLPPLKGNRKNSILA
ncbi:hypothetical protein ASG97_18420 [Bacillus sp. Soil745]|nr:hypothetical protein ASG97_18420 [Bacillus sp. Soil745]PAW26383.1 hypothetical protein BKC07_25055 [Peribacillus simplex]PHD75433.1 hypothetical protein COF64_13065 [Bacillus sp. AFS043905]PRS32739.1 hypothetical protein C6W19_20175 [Bacillus sp. RJGP41]